MTTINNINCSYNVKATTALFVKVQLTTLFKINILDIIRTVHQRIICQMSQLRQGWETTARKITVKCIKLSNYTFVKLTEMTPL